MGRAGSSLESGRRQVSRREPCRTVGKAQGAGHLQATLMTDNSDCPAANLILVIKARAGPAEASPAARPATSGHPLVCDPMLGVAAVVPGIPHDPLARGLTMLLTGRWPLQSGRGAS